MRITLFPFDVAVLCSLAFVSTCFAQTCLVWNTSSVFSGSFQSGTAACQAWASFESNADIVVSVSGVSEGGAPSSSSDTLMCSGTEQAIGSGNPQLDGKTVTANFFASSASGSSCPAPPVCSSSVPSMDVLSAVASSSGSGSSGGFCVAGCEFASVAAGIVMTVGASNQRLNGRAVPTGLACGATGTKAGGDVPASAASCTTTGGATACVDSVNSRGTFSVVPTATPDAIVPATPSQPDSCVSYASGAVACNANAAITSPPAPSSPTSAGLPAVPSATVVGPNGAEVYFTAAQVAASKGSTNTATSSSNPGAPAGATTAVLGTGSASGTGTNPSDCDTSNNASACTGTLPSVGAPECSSYGSCLAAFYTEVQSAPVFESLSAITAALPSGACPSETVTLTTFSQAPGGGTFDYGTPMCNLWTNSAVPVLAAVMLMFWSLVGIFIVLSS